jgi:hypothetical protein
VAGNARRCENCVRLRVCVGLMCHVPFLLGCSLYNDRAFLTVALHDESCVLCRVQVRLPEDFPTDLGRDSPTNGKAKPAAGRAASPVGKVKELMNVFGRR